MHRCAPRPSPSKLTSVDVAATMEATAGAREDRATFVATLRRCARSLEKFRAEIWLLEMLGGGGKEATASLVAMVVRDAKRELKGLGRMLGCG